MNKKFGLIEILFLVFPFIVAYINATYSSVTSFEWAHDRINEISSFCLVIGLLGNIYIYWQNGKYQPPSKIWSFVSIFLIILLVLFLYVGNSISHFGF